MQNWTEQDEIVWGHTNHHEAGRLFRFIIIIEANEAT